MLLPMPDDELVRYLAGSLGVSTDEARRVVLDVLGYYDEPIQGYVRRRHGECRLRGMHNDEIYPLIQQELAERLVAAPRLSVRQVRRMIYG